MPVASGCLLLTSATRIHVMALDGLINVNSLFTVALFLGLTATPGSTISAPIARGGLKASCVADNEVAEQLVAFHVYSFSSFLFSSLIALALKQAIKITDWPGSGGDDCCDMRRIDLGHINLAGLRVGILVSGVGSVFGCGFLMMALVNLVQIKLGTLACGSLYTLAAIVPLAILVPSALFIYVCLVFYSFKH
ncbi:uncharacterized protein LOC116211133 [Punica granatum]|uniref:Uncharacterized protein LOC116211133 n=2 Tax=Punica granatum TaxID=22663 RepID=A0A6P8E7W4_PUNGR|nr:uncharacterized protein LOC116211133 [Punica granatum]PKI66496.1 hypothetical protein CRG98_013152 [Punica granatum]